MTPVYPADVGMGREIMRDFEKRITEWSNWAERAGFTSETVVAGETSETGLTSHTANASN